MSTLTQFHQASSAQALAHDLATFVAGRLREGVSARGQALLIVSGGSTPVPFFDALAQADLEWPQVTVTLADERWLPPDHPDSNERLVRSHLLHGRAALAHFVPLYTGLASPEQALPQLVPTLTGLAWPADVVALGMGSDGHTASLFPHAPELHAALNGDARDTAPCVAVPAPALPNVPVPRISLTAPALLNARALVILITGAAKWALLQQAMLAGSMEDLPIRLALHQSRVPCHVFHEER